MILTVAILIGLLQPRYCQVDQKFIPGDAAEANGTISVKVLRLTCTICIVTHFEKAYYAMPVICYIFNINDTLLML
jgi:hypothetical protein